jgi:hypothetical protein
MKMEPMTYEEFADRAMDLQRARSIFIDSGLTQNISTAFEAYKEILIEEELREEVRLFISTMEGADNSPFDKLIRPKCEECGSDLKLKEGAVGPEGKFYQTAWVCVCELEYYSDKTAVEWYLELKETTDENR